MRLVLILLLAFAGPLRAEGERAGDFDYYVLSLSWTPSWCAAEGDARDSDQCDAGRGHGFTLHGLWPQNETGWPSFCRTAAGDPSRRQTAAMADIMGSGGLAWHQWKKHGRCSGLDAASYFALARDAYARVLRPGVFRKLPGPVNLPPRVIEDAFIEANPGLTRDGITVTCRDNRIQEVRICMTRDLGLRDCAPDTRRDCGAPRIGMAPIR